MSEGFPTLKDVISSPLRNPMKPRVFCLLLLCASVHTVGQSREPFIRVQIISTLDRIAVVPSCAWSVQPSNHAGLVGGKQAVIECNGTRVRLNYGDITLEDTLFTMRTVSDTGKILVRSVPYGVGWWWEGMEDRVYEGELRVRAIPGGKLSVVVSLSLERYLRGVVPFEIGGAPLEALRAQTVAARSEAMAALRNRMYAGNDFDICGDVDCQVFGGILRTTAEIDRAIRTTRGVVLQSKGVPLNAYFASNCGGYSESIENVWPWRSGKRAYWSAHPDADSLEVDSLQDEGNVRRWLAADPATFCNPQARPGLPDWSRRHWRWSLTTSADSLGLTSNGARAGRVIRIDSVRRGNSGRIISAVFVGEKGRFRVSTELEFRQVWTPPLRSSCVVVDPQGPPQRPNKFLVTGAGWGHGVGMCQSGAVGMALAGRTAEQILQHYFPTAEIAPAY
jgi:stage II sporulation protein D